MNSISIFKLEQRNLAVPKYFARLLIVGLGLLVVCIVASILFGTRTLGLQDLLDGLFRPDVDSYEANIVRKRIARTVFSLCCGAALGVSGAVMQAITRNPIADPGILGVNTGAALFVVAGISFMNITTASQYIGYAFAGSILTAILVFGVSSMGNGGATPLKLVLAGAATSAALASLVTAIMLPRTSVMDQFRYWQVGSVGGGDWDSVTVFIPFLLIGMIIALLTAPGLNALALGDEAATGLGVRTGLLRLIAAFAGVLLCAVTTALAGPIGFVGLLATHVIRLLLGADIRYLIPMSALTGAVILTFSDVIGRLIGRPSELEVGVLTAFIGAPLLIVLAMKAKLRL